MLIRIITLFPDFFTSPFSMGVIDGARERGSIAFDIVNLRDYARNKHRKCDDYCYGGGPGMLMSVQPFITYYDEHPKGENEHVVLFAPTGTQVTQARIRALSEMEHVTFICGHYEGIDARVTRLFVDETLSLGDYVVSAGEIPAVVLTDAIARYKGVLGNDDSVPNDTFEEASDGLLEYDQYTRPLTARGQTVPEVLREGKHKEIDAFRRKSSIVKTFTTRGDLFRNADITKDDIHTVFDFIKEKGDTDG